MVASTLTLVKEFSSNCVEESVANEFFTAQLLFYLCRRVDSRVEILESQNQNIRLSLIRTLARDFCFEHLVQE